MVVIRFFEFSCNDFTGNTAFLEEVFYDYNKKMTSFVNTFTSNTATDAGGAIYGDT